MKLENNMGELSLHGEWLATWADGLHGKARHASFSIEDPARYIHFRFPGSIQANLYEMGIIEDPRVGINSLKARWVEEHFWILRKTFNVPPEAVEQSPTLYFEVLDGVAQVLVNNIKVGEHSNSHRPAFFDLSLALRPGENELVVLIESGLFRVADLPGSAYSITDDTILNKRYHLRQPQYQFGWDWNPRMIYFGLHGDLRVSWGEYPRLRQVSVISALSNDLVEGHLKITPTWFVPGDHHQVVSISVSSEDGTIYESNLDLPAGEVEELISLHIANPKLWWPRGYGEQNLMNLQIEISQNGIVIERRLVRTGFRKVEIFQPPHPEEGFYFQIKINNLPVFCKGSNWVPPEMSAFEVSQEKLRNLIEVAIDEGFNILRIWGGGVWAGHDLLSMCDEAGIMVWHDLLFACSKYPADQPDFMREVQKEITWGIKEFSPYPSLVVWCGNNELEWGLWSWEYQEFGTVAPDYALFHLVIPSLLRKVDPSRPYWPSSPYSSPDTAPNEPTRGDQHPWQVSILDQEHPENIWQYRNFIDRFPNEGGVLGISPDASLQEFLVGDDYLQRSIAWEHHDNTVNFWLPRLGVGYLMVEDWFGQPYSSFAIPELANASGMVQAEGLKEYIRNYRRRWPSTSSAIYWDFVDSWPSVHGWGTIDYYLRKKPSYYVVKRANQPIIVVLTDEPDESSNEIGVYIVNETKLNQDFILNIGQCKPNQDDFEGYEIWVTTEPYSSTRVAGIHKNESLITFARLLDSNGRLVDWDRILFKKIRELPVSSPEIEVAVIKKGDQVMARYMAKKWVWNVILNKTGAEEIADNVFDLLPGIPYDIPLGEMQKPYPIQETGNGLFLNRETRKQVLE
jgi:beta-mannosidase